MPWWAPTAMPTAGRPCWPAGADQGRVCGPISRPRALPRSSAGHWPFRRAMRRICRLRHRADRRRTARRQRFISTPRRNSPPRNCWRRAKAGSSISPASSATASAAALHAPEFTMLEWYRARRSRRTGGDGRHACTCCACAAEIAGAHRRFVTAAGAAIRVPKPSG